MSIIKNVSGPYTINTINHDDPIILDSFVVIINGNLRVIGDTTTITSTDTAVYDNIITLNAGVTGTPILNAGINVNRGTSPNVALRWNESYSKWQITNDGTTYGNITSYTGGVNMQRLSDDPTPVLGGNLFVGSNAIVSTGSIYLDPAVGVTLDGNLTLKKFQGAVPVVSNYNTIYAGNVAAGGSGVYVTTDEGVVDQELITKKRAIVYSIIF
jgi:hypothetical protein